MRSLRRTPRVALLTALGVLTLGAGVAAAALQDTARGGGIELDLPSGWSKVPPARTPGVAEPQTLLVIGTEGVRAAGTDCQVSSYRVPANGAVVVIVGWRDAAGTSGFLPLSALRLRRGTFECFAGRGAVAQVTRRNRDFQINVMVGDRASSDTVEEALEAARSFALVQRSA